MFFPLGSRGGPTGQRTGFCTVAVGFLKVQFGVKGPGSATVHLKLGL